MITNVVQDLRYAIRSFLRAPGVALIAIATLALGIGANAAIFSVVESVLISPFPYPAADRVVFVWRQNKAIGDVLMSPSRNDVAGWRAAAALESITTFVESEMVLVDGEEPLTLNGARVGTDLLQFTGAAPQLGRLFNDQDAASETASRVVLLGEGLWTRRFGRDRGVLGRTIELSDQSYEIVGVLPSNFRLPTIATVDFVMPLAPEPAAKAGSRPPRTSVSAMARLKPGIGLAAAQQEMTAAGVETVGRTGEWSVLLMPPADLSGDTLRRALFILLGAVGCVLLIGCANVANLLLARNAGRRREFAVRAALGASRWRLTRQLLTENLLLAVAGGIAGLGMALWAVDAISAVAPPQTQQLASIRVSRAVFGASLLLSLLTGLVIGLLPAISAGRLTLSEALKQGGRAFGGARGASTRRLLTVAEIALALVLLAGAGLLIRSYARVLGQDLGFNPENLLTVTMNLPTSRYATPAAQAQFADQFAAVVRRAPGIGHAVLASGVPPKDGMIFGQLEMEGLTPGDSGPSMFGGGFVQPGFFEALQIRVLDGRSFVEADLKARSAIINESTARRYWPGQSAVGKRMRLDAKGEWSTIVGVVNDIVSDHGRAAGVQIYLPLANAGMAPDITLLVSATTPPAATIATIKAQAWAIDPKVALDGIQTVEAAIAEGTARPRFNVILLSVFAALGLVLAGIGVYGVTSHAVGMRTQEIGVRMALGAMPSDIRRAVLREALVLALIGTTLGVSAALLAGRAMSRLLFGVSPTDATTLAAVAFVLAAMSLLAAWLPARRAMRVDPMVALRAE